MGETSGSAQRRRNDQGQWVSGEKAGRPRCSFDSCDRFAHARGFCYRHDPHQERKNPIGHHGKWIGKTCMVDGCGGDARSKGMCTKHYNAAEYAAGRRQRTPEQERDAKLWNRYRIRAKDYDAMLEQQGGVCAICDRQSSEGSPDHWRGVLCVDHCHDTGRVRGLLCNDCNVALGRFGSIEIVQRVLAYLHR